MVRWIESWLFGDGLLLLLLVYYWEFFWLLDWVNSMGWMRWMHWMSYDEGDSDEIERFTEGERRVEGKVKQERTKRN